MAENKITKDARRVAKFLRKLEDALERGDLAKAKERCASLHELLDRSLAEHGGGIGIDTQSVVPKEPQ